MPASLKRLLGLQDTGTAAAATALPVSPTRLYVYVRACASAQVGTEQDLSSTETHTVCLQAKHHEQAAQLFYQNGLELRMAGAAIKTVAGTQRRAFHCVRRLPSISYQDYHSVVNRSSSSPRPVLKSVPVSPHVSHVSVAGTLRRGALARRHAAGAACARHTKLVLEYPPEH